MYRLRYLPSSDADMLKAEAYLSEFSLSAADKFARVFEQKTDALIDNPFLYRVYGPRPYFRCMPLLYQYLCFYHVEEDTEMISVHRILREMQDIPNIL